MPIYNEDGTVYQLTRPNPLRVGQNSGDGFRLHNQVGEEVVVEYGRRRQAQVPKVERGITAEDFLREVSATAEKKPEPKAEARPPRPMKSYRKVKCFCLPMLSAVEEDELYGESRQVRRWGGKFAVESLVISDDGVQCRLWVPAASQVEKDSIILVRQDARWWKVAYVREWNSGLLLDCLPSSEKPSFD